LRLPSTSIALGDFSAGIIFSHVTSFELISNIAFFSTFKTALSNHIFSLLFSEVLVLVVEVEVEVDDTKNEEDEDLK
jgi:hypothetical protein